MTYRIAFLCPYFGGFPWYFKYFVKSCATNPDVDFYIISDTGTDIPLPDNVKLLYTSFPELVQQIGEKLGMPVCIPKPYKLCDFKPTYGVVFQEIIRNGQYDFWGHCDIDLVFGRIRHFMTDELLEQHDIISVRHEFTTGFFMLYRNTDIVNQLFRQSRDCAFVLSSPKNFCFDECSIHHRELINGLPAREVVRHIDAMTYVIMAAHDQGIIRACFDLFALEGIPGRVIWNNGVLTLEDKYEALLYHIMIIKGKSEMARKGRRSPPDLFEITPMTIVFPEDGIMVKEGPFPKLNKTLYMNDPQVQIIFGAYLKSASGRFRTCGALA